MKFTAALKPLTIVSLMAVITVLTVVEIAFQIVSKNVLIASNTIVTTALMVSHVVVIQRVLLPGGHLLFRVNSVNDVNYGACEGTEIEHHLYETDDHRLKRYFDEADIREIFGVFNIEFLQEDIMTRYGPEKHLFRGCVKK